MIDNGITLITGSNGGLGSELVAYLLSKGHRNLACHFRVSDEKILPILTEYDLDPARHSFKAELTVVDEVRKMQGEIADKLGPVGNIFNLAGGSTNGMSWKLSAEEYQKVIDMNLTSTINVCREFVPQMRSQSYGRIVNTSSVVAFKGVIGASHYCAAKAAIAGYSLALAQELAGSSVTVNAIALGYFNTGLIDHVPDDIQETIKTAIPLQRFGTPAEIGGLFEYLIGPEGGYMTGQVLHLNGGLYS